MAKARRRWRKWQRWEDQVIKLCGEAHEGLPGQQDAYNEHACWYNSGYSGRRHRGWRFNRRNRMGWRKQGR